MARLIERLRESTSDTLPHDPINCSNRLGAPDAAVPIPTNERDLWVFTWSADPYIIKDFGPQTKGIEIAADYLLPYWMGRYYGFISEGM